MVGTAPAFLSPLPLPFPSPSPSLTFHGYRHQLRQASRRRPSLHRHVPFCSAQRKPPNKQPSSKQQQQQRQPGSSSERNGKSTRPSQKEAPSSSIGRAKQALGTSRETLPPLDTKRTREDFIREGVVDDVEAMGGKGSLYRPEDIRYGIRDFKNPFKGKKDGKGGAVVEEEEEGEGRMGKGVSVAGVERGLTEDGGVVKTIVDEGTGAIVAAGAQVVVEYEGKLENGKKFDASTDRGQDGFKFVLGKGQVIKGWDIAIGTMRVGEKAMLKIAPKYAYGTRGVPPVIPSRATLTFDVKLLGASEVQEKVPRTVAGYNPGVPRTPEDISAAYERKMEEKRKQKKKSWFERIYIISPFASQTGERPPWFLNPNITFVIVFLIVAAAFYLVYISGGIHQGFVEDVDVNIFK